VLARRKLGRCLLLSSQKTLVPLAKLVKFAVGMVNVTSLRSVTVKITGVEMLVTTLCVRTTVVAMVIAMKGDATVSTDGAVTNVKCHSTLNALITAITMVNVVTRVELVSATMDTMELHVN
jgi:ABC-type Co2+ transport system permease subunit